MKQLAFIPTGQMPDTFARLNRGVRSRSLVSMVAHTGAGRRALLRHWAAEEPKPVDASMIVMLDLVEPKTKLFGAERIVTPATLVLFSRLYDMLLKLGRVSYRDWLEVQDQKVGRMYTDGQFLTLLGRVEKAVVDLGIRAIMLHNMQHSDSTAMDWVIHLWEQTNQQFAIILSAQMHSSATAEEPLKNVLSGAPSAKQCRTDAWEIKVVQEPEFRETVLPHFYLNLDMEFAPETEARLEEFDTMVWRAVQGNWKATVRLATIFDEELGLDTGNLRILTWRIVERVFARYYGTLQL